MTLCGVKARRFEWGIDTPRLAHQCHSACSGLDRRRQNRRRLFVELTLSASRSHRRRRHECHDQRHVACSLQLELARARQGRMEKSIIRSSVVSCVTSEGHSCKITKPLRSQVEVDIERGSNDRVKQKAKAGSRATGDRKPGAGRLKGLVTRVSPLLLLNLCRNP